MSIVRRIVFACWLIMTVCAWPLNELRHFMKQDQKQFTGIFILRWPAAYCQFLSSHQNLSCDEKKLALWDSQSFVVGGMWMSTKFSKHYFEFSHSNLELDKSLEDRMHNYWPNFLGAEKMKSPQSGLSQYSFWASEWNIYGKDYAQAIQQLFPEEFQIQKRVRLQRAYFDDAIKLYQQKFSGIQKLIKSSILHPEEQFLLERNEIANLLDVKQGTFILKCLNNSSLLYEVQVCIKLDEDGLFQTECSEVERESTFSLLDSCFSSFELLCYGRNVNSPLTSAGRVTSYYPQDIIAPQQF